ncbi:unnamed protein product, partial [Amoebophrya sp. A25]|eukprot:GSA25T00003474001.1
MNAEQVDNDDCLQQEHQVRVAKLRSLAESIERVATTCTTSTPKLTLLELRSTNKVSIEIDLFQACEKMKKLYAQIREIESEAASSCTDKPRPATATPRTSSSTTMSNKKLRHDLFPLFARKLRLKREIAALEYQTSEQSLYWLSQLDAMAAVLVELGYISTSSNKGEARMNVGVNTSSNTTSTFPGTTSRR